MHTVSLLLELWCNKYNSFRHLRKLLIRAVMNSSEMWADTDSCHIHYQEVGCLVCTIAFDYVAFQAIGLNLHSHSFQSFIDLQWPPYTPLTNMFFNQIFNESLHSSRSGLVWATLVALGLISLSSLIIAEKVVRADGGKVQVCQWSAALCIRWTKIVCQCCIMATMWHFYGDATHIFFMVWGALKQLAVVKGSICPGKNEVQNT